MTDETKMKVEHDTFREMRQSAATCIKATIGEPVEDSLESMKKAVSKLKTQNPTGEEFADVLFAAMKWMHAYCEQWTYEKVRAAKELLEHEKEALEAEASAEKPAVEKHGEPVPEAPVVRRA